MKNNATPVFKNQSKKHNSSSKIKKHEGSMMENQSNATPATKTPIVQIIENKPMASSLDVAEFFEKQHKNVLQKIRNLEQKYPDFWRLNFKPCEIIREIPLQGQKAMPYYNMTRAGFSLVVLGFTGDKALKFQIAYVNRFEEMEAALMGKVHQPALSSDHDDEWLDFDSPINYTPDPDIHDDYSTVEDRKPLTGLIKYWASITGMQHAKLYQWLHASMGVTSVEKLKLSQLSAAKTFVQDRIKEHFKPVLNKQQVFLLEKFEELGVVKQAQLLLSLANNENYNNINNLPL